MPRDLVHFMQAMLGPLGRQETPWHPPADVYRTRDGWLLKFDLSGVRPVDIEVTTRGPQVRVHGIRRDSSKEEGCRCYRMEIAYSQFERVIEMPESLDRAKIESEYRDGMLFVRIRT